MTLELENKIQALHIFKNITALKIKRQKKLSMDKKRFDKKNIKSIMVYN